MKWKNNRNQNQRDHAHEALLCTYMHKQVHTHTHQRSISHTVCTECVQWILFIAASTKNGFYFSIWMMCGVVAVSRLYIYVMLLFVYRYRAVVLLLESILSDMFLSCSFFHSLYVRVYFVCTCIPLFVVSSLFIYLLHPFCSVLRHKMSDFCNLSMPASVSLYVYCN